MSKTAITKKDAERISELVNEAHFWEKFAESRSGMGDGSYIRSTLREGLAVRALFEEFGIQANNLGFFTEDRINGLKITVAEYADVDQLESRLI